MSTFVIQPMLQILVPLITVLSSFFLIRSVLALSPIEVAKISAAHLDFNPKVGKSFAIQKADTIVGFSLLLLSALLQGYIISQPLRWSETAGLNCTQTLNAIFVFSLIAGISELVRRGLIKKFKNEFKVNFKENEPKN